MSSELPTVSIVISMYNGAPFLERGPNSTKNQTFADWHVIAVDDESSGNRIRE